MPGVEADSGADSIDAEAHVGVQHGHVLCRFRLEHAEAGVVSSDIGGVQVAQRYARLALVVTDSRRGSDSCGEFVEIGAREVPLDQEQADGTSGRGHTSTVTVTSSTCIRGTTQLLRDDVHSRELGPRAHTEFAVDPGEVAFDRSYSDEERFGDLKICAAGAH